MQGVAVARQSVSISTIEQHSSLPLTLFRCLEDKPMARPILICSVSANLFTQEVSCRVKASFCV